MSNQDDDICDDGEEGGKRKRSPWDRCVLGSVISISTGIILGTVGTVVLASELPVMVGTGVGMSMAAAYCSKTFRNKGGPKAEEDPTCTLPMEEDDDEICQCYCDAEKAAQLDEEFEENDYEKPCTMTEDQDSDEMECTCTCRPVKKNQESCC